jgi:predicted PurR-regulated permease PerM
VVALAYFAGQLIYRLRDIILLLIVAGFVALILNPVVVALQHWRIRRRGLAVAVVTLWALIVFVGLAAAFGYPLANAITHLAHALPGYVSDAEHGRHWIGRLVRRYNIQSWVQTNAPKLVGVGQDLARPALTLGKGAFTLVLALVTVFVLVLLLLLEGPKMRTGLVGLMEPARAARYSRIAREVNRSVTGYMLGNFLTSLIAGVVVLVTLLVLISILVGASIGSWIDGIFGAFVAALLAIPAAGAIQVLIRELWQATAPPPPPGGAESPPGPAIDG